MFIIIMYFSVFKYNLSIGVISDDYLELRRTIFTFRWWTFQISLDLAMKYFLCQATLRFVMICFSTSGWCRSLVNAKISVWRVLLVFLCIVLASSVQIFLRDQAIGKSVSLYHFQIEDDCNLLVKRDPRKVGPLMNFLPDGTIVLFDKWGLVSVLLPFSLICIMYICIIFKTIKSYYKSGRAVNVQQPDPVSCGESGPGQHRSSTVITVVANQAGKIRVITCTKSLSTQLLALLTIWGGMAVSFPPDQLDAIDLTIYIGRVHLLYFLHVSVDPLICYMFNSDFRKAVKSLLHCN
jgi:hypothetical protein